MCANWRSTLHRAVLLSSGVEIGIDGILSPDGGRLDQQRTNGARAQCAIAAEQVTRNLVGRTVAEVERDLILETLKLASATAPHAANILGISIPHLAPTSSTNIRRRSPIPPAGGGEAMEARRKRSALAYDLQNLPRRAVVGKPKPPENSDGCAVDIKDGFHHFLNRRAGLKRPRQSISQSKRPAAHPASMRRGLATNSNGSPRRRPRVSPSLWRSRSRCCDQDRCLAARRRGTHNFPLPND